MSIALKGMDHPAVAAKDVDKLAKWYCDVLGYEKYHRIDKPVWILKAPDNSLIEIMPEDETARLARNICTPGWSHIALRVENLENAIAYLQEQNVEWIGETVDAIGGGRLRSFYDPEGNMLQVVERSI